MKSTTAWIWTRGTAIRQKDEGVGFGGRDVVTLSDLCHSMMVFPLLGCFLLAFLPVTLGR